MKRAVWLILLVLVLGVMPVWAQTPEPTISPAESPSSVTEADAPLLSTDPPSTMDKVLRWRWDFIIPIALWIIVFVVLLYHFVQTRGEIWFLPRDASYRCWLARIALLLYILFMGIPIGQLTKGLYGESGKIFWQISSAHSGLSLVDDFDGSYRNLPNFEESADCVGCHIYHPETQRLVFTSGGMTGAVSLWDGAEVVPLGFNASYFSFSPDGSQFVYAYNDEDLYIYNFTLGTTFPLVGASAPDVIETMPSWSSDGNTIVFARNEAPLTGLENRLTIPTDLYFVPASGGQASPVQGAAEPGVFEYYPSYSPDGLWLAFTRHTDQTTYADANAEIWLLPAIGGEAHYLAANDTTSGENAGNSWSVWSPDSQWLAFGSKRQDATFDILVAEIHPDGTSSQAYTLEGGNQRGVFEHRPVWWAQPAERTLQDAVVGAIPWLLPLIPLILLVNLLCRGGKVEDEIVWERNEPQQPVGPVHLPPADPMPVLWIPQPVLIVGLGDGGRHVLTHLKKNLLDAGLGTIPEQVKLLCITHGSPSSQREKSFQVADVALSDAELITWQDSLLDIAEAAPDDDALAGWVNTDYLKSAGDDTLNPRNGMKGQRSLGRLALIQNLRGDAQQTGKLLLQELKQAILRVRDPEGRLQVIVVSEVGDDVGSGGFLDTTALIHQLRAELNLTGIYVSGHLLTERTRPHHEAAQQINTVSALRELARFQLASNTPFQMRYNRHYSETDQSVWRQSLFDELYLYDGESQSAPLNVRPELGIYPAIADSITLWIDTAAKQANLYQHRMEKTQNTRLEQSTARRLMVGSLGIYQYRLPFRDLLNEITLRFARSVLQVVLMGSSTERPHVEPTLVSEALLEDLNKDRDLPDQLAAAFLKEKLGGAPRLHSAWRALLYKLTASEEKDLAKVVNQLKKSKDTDEAGWKEWLNNTLLIILNGSSRHGKLPPSMLRGAKISLALEFLARLSADGQRKGRLPSMREAVLARTNDEKHPAIEYLTRFAEYVEALYTQLFAIARSLGLTFYEDSLAFVLDQQSHQLEQAKNTARQFQTRRYIVDDSNGVPLNQLWYDRYLKDHLEEAVSQCYWGIEDGQIQFRLEANEEGEGTTLFDPAAPLNFIPALLGLGRYFAKPIRENESLALILKDTILDADQIGRTAEDLMQRCAVMAGVRDVLAPRQSRSLLMSVNRGVAEANELEKRLRSQQHTIDILGLNTSDPFTLSLVQTLDTVPIESINSVQQAINQYLKDEEVLGVRTPSTALSKQKPPLYCMNVD